MQRFVVTLHCRQGIGLISEKRWPDHASIRPQISTPTHIASDVPAMSLMRIGASAPGAIPRVRMSMTALARARSPMQIACNVMMVGNAGMQFAANPHTEIAAFDKDKERIHDIPRCRLLGRAIAPVEVSHGPDAPRPTTATPARERRRGSGRSRIQVTIIVDCNNCCIQNFAEQNELGIWSFWHPQPLVASSRSGKLPRIERARGRNRCYPNKTLSSQASCDARPDQTLGHPDRSALASKLGPSRLPPNWNVIRSTPARSGKSAAEESHKCNSRSLNRKRSPVRTIRST